ncbi:hypothetical protein VTK73DRAFT_9643 [Phialemonium thermophilum]|uniref:Uncharacterized protein n=1 Tax=Phialemonium thermophilum TaxID=223376 RepID=A0ABR3W1H6_9PEZI
MMQDDHLEAGELALRLLQGRKWRRRFPLDRDGHVHLRRRQPRGFVRFWRLSHHAALGAHLPDLGLDLHYGGRVEEPAAGLAGARQKRSPGSPEDAYGLLVAALEGLDAEEEHAGDAGQHEIPSPAAHGRHCRLDGLGVMLQRAFQPWIVGIGIGRGATLLGVPGRCRRRRGYVVRPQQEKAKRHDGVPHRRFPLSALEDQPAPEVRAGVDGNAEGAHVAKVLKGTARVFPVDGGEWRCGRQSPGDGLG